MFTLTEHVKLEKHNDNGVKLSFNLMLTPPHQLDALLACIKRNKERGNISIADTHLDKENLVHIIIEGLENFQGQFIQLVETELLVAIPTTATASELQVKMQSIFDGLLEKVDNPSAIG